MPARVREPRGRGTSVVESRYQATANEDIEDCMCAVVTESLAYVTQ
jgi:hypothetical protein